MTRPFAWDNHIQYRPFPVTIPVPVLERTNLVLFLYCTCALTLDQGKSKEHLIYSFFINYGNLHGTLRNKNDR